MGILDGIGTFLGDEENRLNLASGLAGMTANPNAGNIQQGYQNRLTALRGDRKLEGANKLEAETRTRQVGMALKMLGDKFPMLSQALQAGIISPNDAITAARKGSDVKVVGKSLVDSKGNVIFTSPDASGGDTAALQTLKGRAVEAGLKEGTQAYQQFMMQGGVNKGMTFASDGKGGFTLTQGGATVGKPKTEGQANATGFWNRVAIANTDLEKLENQGTKFGANLLSALPFGMGNIAQTPEFQLYSQSQEDWINAVLRDESGAAIGPEEFDSAKTQYFPQVGDGPEVIAQKKRNRKTKELGLWTKSGQETDFPTGYKIPSAGSGSGMPSGVTVKKVGP